jgi:hypothetical protein
LHLAHQWTQGEVEGTLFGTIVITNSVYSGSGGQRSALLGEWIASSADPVRDHSFGQNLTLGTIGNEFPLRIPRRVERRGHSRPARGGAKMERSSTFRGW